MKFNEFASSYLVRNKHKLKVSTWINYGECAKSLNKFVGEREVSDLRPMDADTISASLVEQGMSIGRINVTLCFFRVVMSDAKANGYTALEFSSVKNLKNRTRSKVDPLTHVELQKIIACVDPFFKPFFQFCAMTGCRPCEAMALTWSDIGDEFVSFSRGRYRGAEGTTKTDREREFPLIPQLADVLLEQRKRSSGNYVFVTKKGLPIDDTKNVNLNRIWKQALIMAGVEHHVRYQLRHSFASNSINAGMPVPVVSSLLGHSNINTTIQRYTFAVKDGDKGRAKLQEMYQ